MDKKTEQNKSGFWPYFFSVFFLNICVWFAIGFVVAFNPAVKKDVGWEPFMWFAGNYIFTQWLYLLPIALILYKWRGSNPAKGALLAGLGVSLLIALYQFS
jgi:hypothetical protein